MDLQRFTVIIFRSLRGILLLTVVAGVAAFAVSTVLPKEWESEARLLVGQLTETDTQQLEAYQQLATTYAEVATSTPTMQRVITRLALPDDPEDLAKRVAIRTAVGQAVIKVTAAAGSPQAAADLANAFASEIVRLGLPGTRNARSLVSRYQPGVPPQSPSSPKILINTLIAAAVGFVVGVGLAVLLAMVRDARQAGTDGGREVTSTAMVPTVGPALVPSPGRGAVWPPGVGSGAYPTIAVNAVAPMPRAVEREPEPQRIAETSNVPPTRPPTVSAWGPQPIRSDPYVAVTPTSTPRTPAPVEDLPTGPTFLEIIEARTAPPPRMTTPSGMGRPATNGGTAYEATRPSAPESMPPVQAAPPAVPMPVSTAATAPVAAVPPVAATRTRTSTVSEAAEVTTAQPTPTPSAPTATRARRSTPTVTAGAEAGEDQPATPTRTRRSASTKTAAVASASSSEASPTASMEPDAEEHPTETKTKGKRSTKTVIESPSPAPVSATPTARTRKSVAPAQG